jgi:hypothetical protein
MILNLFRIDITDLGIKKFERKEIKALDSTPIYYSLLCLLVGL